MKTKPDETLVVEIALCVEGILSEVDLSPAPRHTTIL